MPPAHRRSRASWGVASAVIAAGACKSDERPAPAILVGDAQGGGSHQKSPLSDPLRIDVQVLAHPLDHPHGLGLDDTYVYFSDDDGDRRVPRRGGPVEAGPHIRDQTYAYPDETDDLAYDGHTFYRFAADGIWREDEHGKNQVRTRLARTFPSDYRKVLVVDGDHLYWIEPAAGAVLSVPTAGGAVAFVCEAYVPVHYALALHGDTLYRLNIDGGLAAVDRRGGALHRVGVVDKLGSNRNGLWMAAGDDALYIVSDALGAVRDPRRDGAVVRVAYPGPGKAEADHDRALLFATNVGNSGGAPAAVDLQRLDRDLAPISDELRAGRTVLTLAVAAVADATEAARNSASPLDAWLHEQLGPDLRTEIVVTAPDSAPAPKVDPTIYVGVTRDRIPALFAPD